MKNGVKKKKRYVASIQHILSNMKYTGILNFPKIEELNVFIG